MSEVHFKILVVGESNVGKTSLVRAWGRNTTSTSNYKATIGVDFTVLEISYKGNKVIFQLWDIAGQDRDQSLTRIFARQASAVFFVFDCSRFHTLIMFEKWYKSIQDTCERENIPVVLLGNKVDLCTESVSFDHPIYDQIQHFEKLSVFTSAHNGRGVDDALQTMLRQLWTDRKRLSLHSSRSTLVSMQTELVRAEKKSKESSCCS